MNENLQSHRLRDADGRLPYLLPRVKVRSCEISGLLAGSGGGNGAGSIDPDPGGDIDDGNGGGAIFGGGGAKSLRDFSSFDLWDE